VLFEEMADLNDKIRTVIGDLLLRAESNPLAKAAINAYDPFSKKTANYKSLSKFNLDVLEPCAEFLCVGLSDLEGNKIFTKDSLVYRIIQAFSALLPTKCSECDDMYAVDLEPESLTLFTCYMCFQGSHDCSSLSALHTALTSVLTDVKNSGFVWLCSDCLVTSNPVKPRKSKSRHDSVSSIASDKSSVKSEPALTRIRNESMNSPAGQSPGELSNFPSPASHSSVQTVVRGNKNTEKRPVKLPLLTEVHSSNDQPPDICYKYRAGKCPHGAKGTKMVDGKQCGGLHPERCKKYCNFGSKPDNGCNKGKECKFYHPIICRNTLRYGKCKDNKCSYVHPRQRHGKSKPVSDNKGTESAAIIANTADINVDNSKSDEQSNFLLFQGLVERMQESFNHQLADIRASLQQLHYPVHPMQNGHMLGHQFRHVPNLNTHQGMGYIPQPSY